MKSIQFLNLFKIVSTILNLIKKFRPTIFDSLSSKTSLCNKDTFSLLFSGIFLLGNNFLRKCLEKSKMHFLMLRLLRPNNQLYDGNFTLFTDQWSQRNCS
jgi:hypothetical protein